MSNKPRKNKLDTKKFFSAVEAQKKKEQDWTFEDILRSKPRGKR